MTKRVVRGKSNKKIKQNRLNWRKKKDKQGKKTKEWVEIKEE